MISKANGLSAFHTSLKAVLLGTALAVAPLSVVGITTAAIAEEAETETDRLNAFFEEEFEKGIKRSPIYQSYLGIKTDYDKWDDPSEEASIQNLADQVKSLSRMRTNFDFDKLSEQGQLSYRLYEQQAERQIRAAQFRNHRYYFNQMGGGQSRIPAFLINIHRISNESDAEAYISRLLGVKAYVNGMLKETRKVADLGILPPKLVFPRVIGDAENVIKGAPFDDGEPSTLLADFTKKVSRLEVDDDRKAQLIKGAEAALIASVQPAYEAIIELMKAQIATATTDDGVWKLPDGERYYAERLAWHTTTDMTADEVHDLGLAEVARIHDEMRAIMKKVEFEGTLSEFFTYLREDDQFYYEDSDEGRAAYLADATSLIDTMRKSLPDYFGVLPKADLIVKAVEPFRAKSAGKAFYQRPAPDGSRPGTYYANLYDIRAMPTYQMEALAYHEGIPGHHLQLAIATELKDVPKFRKFGGFTVYSEGWGLYTEYLPKEMGFYTDPYSDFGRLAMELWRAARLVVDTGLHHKKWSREKAIQYLMDNTPNAESDAVKAIERYIVMPGQATAYKIGMLKILELRAHAKEALGEAFDIRGFHDTVLASGPLPLSILAERIDDWIAEVKAGA